MGEILHFIEKFLNALFLVKKGPNNKNLDIILFAYSRGARKPLFHYSGHKDTQVMGICLCHVETIVHDRSFFTNFAFTCSEER